MKVTLESTTKIVTLVAAAGSHDAVQARVWEGTTDLGVPVFAFVTRIAPLIENPGPVMLSEFENDLAAMRAPSPELAALPLRLII